MKQYAGDFLIFVLLVSLTTSVDAFQLSGRKWRTITTSFDVGMSEPWDSAFIEAANSWNNATIFTIGINNSFLDPCLDDNKNGVGFNTTVCGNSFGVNTLAVTMSIFSVPNNEFIETDIVYNQNENWDVYNGLVQIAPDFRRVSVHELGHALGLDHQTNSAIDSIMDPFIGNIEVPQNDDITGVDSIYINQCDPASFNTIGPNEVVQGDLITSDCKINDLNASFSNSNQAFVDPYQVTLSLPGQLDIDLEATNVDSFLILLDSGRNFITENDDASVTTLNAHISQVLSAGQYFIYASSLQPEDMGTYQLFMSCIACEVSPGDDFGGDGKADILIRNTSGFISMYEMDGAIRMLSAVGGLSNNWTVEGIGDFGGDGNADILIRNSSGFLAMYEMNGAMRSLSAVGGLPTNWSVVGVGDFGGDGKADILIRNSSGFLSMYQMNGASRTLLAVGGLPLDWNVEQVGDFNGDGKADILIRNSNGYMAMYQMDGASRTLLAVGGLPIDWNIEKLGDFNGDGKADILIRNGRGFLSMYQMEGASRTLLPIGGLPLDWSIVQVSDFDGDSKADILIRKSNGFLAMYQMNGSNRTLLPVGGLPTAWTIQPIGQP